MNPMLTWMRIAALAGLCGVSLAARCPAEEAVAPTQVEAPPEASPDEPLAPEFSALLAAQYLDSAALNWLTTHECAACHTMFPYQMARPALASVLPVPPQVRQFFEDIAAGRKVMFPDYLPVDGKASIVVGTAVSLAMNDRFTTGKLHAQSRKALDEMWSWQRADGSWEWPYRDSPPIKLDEHYGVTFAAIGVGMAPDAYAQSEAARAGLDRIRHFLAEHPPRSLHEKAMLLWASSCVDGLLAADEKTRVLEELLKCQRPDGGWPLAALVENLGDARELTEKAAALLAEEGYGKEFAGYQGQNGVYKVPLTSDGYATGFVVYVARQAGLPAENEHLRKGVAWLRSNQRASGRWFTHSIGPPHSRHLISNAGTAYAVMALSACGEIP